MAQSNTQWNLDDNIAELLESDSGMPWEDASVISGEGCDRWFEENLLMEWPDQSKHVPEFTLGLPLVSPTASPMRFFRQHLSTSPMKRCYGGVATVLGKRRAPAPTPPPSPELFEAPAMRPKGGGELWCSWASRVAGRVFVPNGILGGVRAIAM